MTLGEILARVKQTESGFDAVIPETWMQGRTAYGGLSTALALEAARSVSPDLPSLRSAQISFVGPLAGAVQVRPTLLRHGRSAAFIGVDVLGEAGLGLRATFVFMRGRPSGVDYSAAAPPEVVRPETAEAAFKRTAGPHFTDNFDYRHARPATVTADRADFLRWVRLIDPEGVASPVGLMALGDALPPAAMDLMVEKGPVSSITWMINLLVDAPVTRDGWWLMRSTSAFARQGCSSQAMAIWNADGEPVATGMQSVALFA